ncbi:glycine betaine ABC transporter substrate-binding protein [Virgibacillus sp. SK37]|uniref:glycine betaine ABC transporter substrate-binding protein n=1 Tax=Virgibacillus sp. SK37 TaxID=403957 RepID=UPI0004D1A405|nr:glycine betaine ABC transporter substrate-binding protein [Virgibacillus sp. SK37]AIF42705.1 glycine/betaine ABC transporter substrate-binding protein [Virgibacillus sp. SK37]
MFKFDWKKLGIAAGLSLSLVAAGCGSDEEGSGDSADSGSSDEQNKEIELAYVEWDTEVASTNVVKQVLEEQGFDVTITPLDNAVMWQSVANNETDGMVAAWLPGTHGDLYEQHKSDLEDLGANLEGAKIGMVVPEYMDVSSIEDLSDEAGKTITGIEPGAGVVKATEKATEEYDNLADWEVKTSSSGAMATALGEAVENEEEIVITGWSPHWKFQKYDLKYLEDPKGVYGEAEEIKTMVRKDLKEDMPQAYKILDAFHWEQADIESVMLDIQNGTDPEEAAANWIKDNQDKVDEWVKAAE